MTLAPKSLPLQDDRFILQMFILLQVAASPAVPIWRKMPPRPIFPQCFLFLHVNILGDAGVDLFKLEGKTVQENSFFLYSILHFCLFKSPLCVFYNLLCSVPPMFTSAFQGFRPWSPFLHKDCPPTTLFSVFTMKWWVFRQSYSDAIKSHHLCGV